MPNLERRTYNVNQVSKVVNTTNATSCSKDCEFLGKVPPNEKGDPSSNLVRGFVVPKEEGNRYPHRIYLCGRGTDVKSAENHGEGQAGKPE
jgi:hypothetical protein